MSMPKLFIRIFIMLVFLSGCHGESQKPDRFKVGIYIPAPELLGLMEEFKKGLADNGYMENANLIYINAGNEVSGEKYAAFIDTVIKEEVDVIFTATTPAALKIKKSLENSNIPIVFALVGEPVKSGIVKDMIHPGGDLTGIQSMNAGEKGFQWVCKIVPDLKRMYVPLKPDDIAMALSVPVLKAAASRYQVELVFAEVNSEKELLFALDQIPEDVQAVWQLPSPYWSPFRTEFINACIKHKKTLKVHNFTAFQQGALIAYGLKDDLLGKQAARMAHKILQGASPSDMPVEQTDFYLSLNLKTAEKIGLAISGEILKQADFLVR